ncbi:thioredoxin domain-containing protein [Leuconostoc suionicum]|uniref:thioredoxin domain-containing protein n=1 Tax=Leuconostoc suionicum TaxID=1511761 RepID=UPI0024ADEA48|nr:thioredoxin domain-containing protein [Leuconostoc suionicum]MDI6498758.1 thioredoxin domain-containing protein [Leuconostoc suionicum]MDI6500800.1 thioredoxin domain-containing protein [Leuconostoc suionicum]MDI6502968.1 thioredoxin domain-containing protein [Leuconostoc suionicum]MDI6614736.1 thioredoxin domain-containing protein [Leuconostoc suionicum]MDI6665845.1 thioredoxin domain-containing protein [Leuconostoc suionicum]
MKQRIKRLDKNKPSRSLTKIIIIKVLPVIAFLVVGFLLVPYGSMYFQNNKVDKIQAKNEAVLFYNTNCPHCQNIYPKIFWHNVLNFNNKEKQIQTINVQNENNKHYLAEFAIQATPTFMKTTNTNQRLVSTNSQKINYFIKGGH